jgi:hypothetical protein
MEEIETTKCNLRKIVHVKNFDFALPLVDSSLFARDRWESGEEDSNGSGACFCDSLNARSSSPKLKNISKREG